MSSARTSPRSEETGGVLIIGAGGLGCPAALALAAAGVTRLGVVDDDRVDTTNLHRQVLFTDADVGAPKAAAFAAALARRYPDVQVTPHAVRFEVGNALELIDAYEVVVDATDNFAAKFLANDATVLAGKPLVHGAAVGHGGQLLTVPSRGRPCYRCLFEEPPPAGVGASCAEAGVLGPVPGVIGALLGAEAARLLKGESPAFVGRLVQYDSPSMSVRTVRFNPNPLCAVCAPGARIHALSAVDYPAVDCATP
jgi:molybdopterin/thiamine biosynthesis adenylyltransferase